MVTILSKKRKRPNPKSRTSPIEGIQNNKNEIRLLVSETGHLLENITASLQIAQIKFQNILKLMNEDDMETYSTTSNDSKHDTEESLENGLENLVCLSRAMEIEEFKNENEIKDSDRIFVVLAKLIYFKNENTFGLPAFDQRQQLVGYYTKQEGDQQSITFHTNFDHVCSNICKKNLSVLKRSRKDRVVDVASFESLDDAVKYSFEIAKQNWEDASGQ